jgi:hypothetical protein
MSDGSYVERVRSLSVRARGSGVVGSPGLLLLGALLALLIAAWVVALAVCSSDLDRADSRLANDFRDRSEL